MIGSGGGGFVIGFGTLLVLGVALLAVLALGVWFMLKR